MSYCLLVPIHAYFQFHIQLPIDLTVIFIVILFMGGQTHIKKTQQKY